MNSLISVVIPAYNASKTIEQSVRSVFDHNLVSPDLVIVNDGSTDATMQVVNRLVKEYGPRISVIDQENSGPVMARQAGFRASASEYLMTVDADDVLMPGAIDRLEAVVRDSGLPDLVIFHGRREGSSHNMWNYPFIGNAPIESSFRRTVFDLFVDTASLNNLVLKLFRRGIFDSKRDYSFAQNFRYGEDALQVLPLLDRAKSIYYLDEALYVYRANPQSVTSVADVRYLNDSKILRQELVQSSANWGLEDTEERINAKLIRSVFSIAQRLSRSGELDKPTLQMIRIDEEVRASLENYSAKHLNGRQRLFAEMLEAERYSSIALYFKLEGMLRQFVIGLRRK